MNCTFRVKILLTAQLLILRTAWAWFNDSMCMWNHPTVWFNAGTILSADSISNVSITVEIILIKKIDSGLIIMRRQMQIHFNIKILRLLFLPKMYFTWNRFSSFPSARCIALFLFLFFSGSTHWKFESRKMYVVWFMANCVLELWLRAYTRLAHIDYEHLKRLMFPKVNMVCWNF